MPVEKGQFLRETTIAVTFFSPLLILQKSRGLNFFFVKTKLMCYPSSVSPLSEPHVTNLECNNITVSCFLKIVRTKLPSKISFLT